MHPIRDHMTICNKRSYDHIYSINKISHDNMHPSKRSHDHMHYINKRSHDNMHSINKRSHNHMHYIIKRSHDNMHSIKKRLHDHYAFYQQKITWPYEFISKRSHDHIYSTNSCPQKHIFRIIKFYIRKVNEWCIKQWPMNTWYSEQVCCSIQLSTKLSVTINRKLHPHYNCLDYMECSVHTGQE